MAGFESALKIVQARRLAELARKHPEVAKLIADKNAKAVAEFVAEHKQPDPAPDFEPKPFG
jgi:hypothetical protein